jgi:SAM-dependent methyltransferase
MAGPFGIDRLVTWLEELVERTCESPPILVGQIVGGAIAAHFAAARRDRLSGLVLADSLGLAPFQPAPHFAAALMAFLAEPSAENHDGLWEQCAFDLSTMRTRMGESWDRLRAYNLDRAGVSSLKPTQQRLMELFAFPEIPPETLARIEAPTILVWGRHDLATPLSVAEAASSRFGWSLHVIDGAGDDPAMEQPAAFVSILEAAAFRKGDGPWDRIAPGYDRTNTETQLWLGNEALRRAGLRPGMRFLDVASGSGALGIPAARIGADVTAVDSSPTMLRLLDRRARKEGLAVETRFMDGHALDFPDDRFDMAGSQFGVMLFPDMPRGIREMARVVKPGGRVLVVAYGDPRRIDFLHFFIDALQAVRPDFTGPPMDPVPLPFQLSDPQRLALELERAGLKAGRVETIDEHTSFKTGDELWDWILYSNPIVGEILSGLQLSEAELTRVRATLERSVRKHADPHGVAVLSNPINIGIATK